MAVMPTDTRNQHLRAESGARHSAFEEFSHEGRRPAVLLLCALVIAALFFAIGLYVGYIISSRNSIALPQSKAAFTS
jgi:hypothetical protein